MQSPFPSSPLPLPPRYFLVRASFANKENSTARAGVKVPSFVRGARASSWCSFKKKHEQHQKYPYSFSKKYISLCLVYRFAWFTAEPPSQRASDETHFFNTNRYVWYFGLTIQNTANRQARNLFCLLLLAVFISFPLARCTPPPHPERLQVTKKWLHRLLI
jgi:hypothetical protein